MNAEILVNTFTHRANEAELMIKDFSTALERRVKYRDAALKLGNDDDARCISKVIVDLLTSARRIYTSITAAHFDLFGDGGLPFLSMSERERIQAALAGAERAFDQLLVCAAGFRKV